MIAMFVRCWPLAAALLCAPAHSQTTWFVDVNGTPPGSGTAADPYTSIQFAIDQAATLPGDSLAVASGTYVENVDVGGKALRIFSVAGPEPTTIQAAGPGPVVVTDAPLSASDQGLEGFTVTGATGTDPGIYVKLSDPIDGAFAVIRRCIVRDNGGPGILNEYDVSIFESTLVGNERSVGSVGLGIVFMRNSISWGNAQPMLLNLSFSHRIDNVLHQGADPGLIDQSAACMGCLNQDPKLWSLAARDLRLRPDSPAIDAGDPSDPDDPDGSTIDLGALTFDPFYAPGTSTYCPGTAALCPCGNGGVGGAGCDIAQGTGGVSIAIRNFTPDGMGGGTAEVLGTGYPPASLPGATLIRSPGVEDPPVVFGDGLRCIAAAGIVRVRAALAQGGSALLPVMHGAGAGTFYYQLWNRNTPIMFCDPTAAFNLSNALEIAWP